MEPRGRAVLAENKFFSARLDIVVSRYDKNSGLRRQGFRWKENLELAIACLQLYDKIEKLWETIFHPTINSLCIHRTNSPQKLAQEMDVKAFMANNIESADMDDMK